MVYIASIEKTGSIILRIRGKNILPDRTPAKLFEVEIEIFSQTVKRIIKKYTELEKRIEILEKIVQEFKHIPEPANNSVDPKE